MWRCNFIQFREFNPIILMWTQHGINTEKLYFLTREEKTTQEEEDTNLKIDFYLFCRKSLQVKKIYEIFCFCRQIINTKLLKGNRLLDITPEAVARRCSIKKVFLQISSNSQENTLYQNPFFDKVAGLWISQNS